jgi:ribonuclease HIII
MNIVIKVSDDTKQKMIEYYADKKRDKVPPYAIFQADEADTIITLYESGKAMFQGTCADIDANMWKETDAHIIKEKKEIKSYYYVNSIGSDEVGTGDYFGPMVVTATYVTKDDINFLEELGVKDSKKMTDEKMLEIAPLIIKKIKYDSLILTNKEYNLKYNKELNMNKIKAIMHNKVISNILNKYNPKYDYIVIDEFAKPKSYFGYLTEVPNVIRNLTFLTKAEDKNLAVACASIISRYIFLKEYDKLSNELGVILPKGASNLVDDMGSKLVEKYGEDKLLEIAKYNFKNTDKILNNK